MCFKRKWRQFVPTQKYLSVVGGLTTITKLHNYLKQFKWQGEKTWKDYWKTPIEFIENKDNNNDCEDFARFAVDVLVRIIHIEEAKFVAHIGYNKKEWGSKIWNLRGHVICVFPSEGKFGVFNNNQLYIGINSYEDAGKLTFPDGLKYQEIRNWEGKILSRKFKLFGTF